MVGAGLMSVNHGRNNLLDLVMDVNDHMSRFMKSCMVLDGSMNSNGIKFK